MVRFPFDNRYITLPPQCFAAQRPTPVAQPELIALNRPLAEALGVELADCDDALLAAVFAGNQIPEGAQPVALAYAGHQFGQFVPSLGDGRAILLGEVVTGAGRRFDVQLKGAGRTPFSRGGDGRAALGPVLREYLLSEAMHALGVPTTRALAAVTTGEAVYRDTPLPGAVITRVASSHIRVGTFQYFAARDDREALSALVDHVIRRHYPALDAEAPADAGQGDARLLALLDAVIARQVALVSQWMSIGFIHGVMNTDNTGIAGETIDYGPCAFMDAYDPGTVFSSIDHGGRYAWGNQPRILQWNMTRFAETLIGLFAATPEAAVAELTPIIEAIGERFAAAFDAQMAAKIGFGAATDQTRELVAALLSLMQRERADFTSTFASLEEALAMGAPTPFVASFGDQALAGEWWQRWHRALDTSGETSVPERLAASNPRFIPRNHLVEEALAAAIEAGDYAPFHTLYEILCKGDDGSRDVVDVRFTRPPAQPVPSYRTFCGT